MLIDHGVINEKPEIARNIGVNHQNLEEIDACSLSNEYERSYLSENDPRKACILDLSREEHDSRQSDYLLDEERILYQ